MITRLHSARLAFHHSPTRERQEVFVHQPSESTEIQINNLRTPNVVERLQQKFRKLYEMLVASNEEADDPELDRIWNEPPEDEFGEKEKYPVAAPRLSPLGPENESGEKMRIRRLEELISSLPLQSIEVVLYKNLFKHEQENGGDFATELQLVSLKNESGQPNKRDIDEFILDHWLTIDALFFLEGTKFLSAAHLYHHWSMDEKVKLIEWLQTILPQGKEHDQSEPTTLQELAKRLETLKQRTPEQRISSNIHAVDEKKRFNFLVSLQELQPRNNNGDRNDEEIDTFLREHAVSIEQLFFIDGNTCLMTEELIRTWSEEEKVHFVEWLQALLSKQLPRYEGTTPETNERKNRRAIIPPIARTPNDIRRAVEEILNGIKKEASEEDRENEKKLTRMLDDLFSILQQYPDRDPPPQVIGTFIDDHKEILSIIMFQSHELRTIQNIFGEKRLEKLNNGSIDTRARVFFDAVKHHFQPELKERRNQWEQEHPTPPGPVISYDSGKAYAASYKRCMKAMKKNATQDDASIDVLIEKNGLPDAFCFGNKIFINPDSVDARDPIERTRVLMHELAHFELDRQNAADTLLEVLGQKKNEKAWQEMKSIIDRIFSKSMLDENDEGTIPAPAFKDDLSYLHEAVAIFMAGEESPYDSKSTRDNRRRTLCIIFKRTLLRDDVASGILDSIKDKTRENYDRNIEHLMKAVGVGIMNETFNDKKEGDPQVRTMDPGGHGTNNTAEIKQELANRSGINDAEKQDSRTDAELREKVTATLEKIKKLKADLPKMDPGNITDEEAKLRHEKGAHTGKELTALHKAGLEAAEEMLTQNESDLIELLGYATIIENWQKVDIKTKAEHARRWSFANANAYEEIMQGLKNASTLQTIDKSDETQADLTRMKNAVKKAMTMLDEQMAVIEEYGKFNEKKEQSEKDKKKDTDNSLYNKLAWFLGKGTGTEWLCYYDIVKIIKLYQEGIVESYKAQQTVTTTRIAKQSAWFLDYVPYGRPTRQIIDRQAKSANDDETGKYAEYLKKQGFTYFELFAPKEPGQVSLLKQNANNINRQKAIIEYGAEHGWLYKLNADTPNDVYGVAFEDEFGPQAFKELLSKYEEGKNHEEERGYGLVKQMPDIKPMIAVLDRETKKCNLFAVKGILKRIQEKGKLGESNVWGAVRFIRALREHPYLLPNLDIGLLDDIGNIGIDKAAWTLTLFKIDRKAFAAWKDMNEKTGNVNESLRHPSVLNHESNRLLKAILTAESLIPGSESMNSDLLDKYVGKILAGQTVTVGGKKISIWNNAFKSYRDFWLKTPSTIDPGSTDDDFFNGVSNDTSDVLLLGSTPISIILGRESQGPLKERNKGANFMASVIFRDQKLKDDGLTEELKNYRAQMKYSLRRALGQAYTQNAARLQIVKERTDANDESPEVSNVNFLDEFWKRDMISDREYIGFALTFTDNDDKRGELMKEVTKVCFEHLSQDGKPLAPKPNTPDKDKKTQKDIQLDTIFKNDHEFLDKDLEVKIQRVKKDGIAKWEKSRHKKSGGDALVVEKSRTEIL